MLTMDYCGMLNRMRVKLGDIEITTMFCSREVADQVFHALQTLQDLMKTRGA